MEAALRSLRRQDSHVPAKGLSVPAKAPDSLQRLRRVVKSIPRGRVMTYGDLAAAAGMPGAARAAGRALWAMGPGVPWQRVLGRKDVRRAHITHERGKLEQRRLLEKEGVRFDVGGGVPLDEFGWFPGRRRSKAPRK